EQVRDTGMTAMTTRPRPSPDTSWPLSSTVVLVTERSSVTRARKHAREIAGIWNPDLASDAELVVSELVTNAIQASWANPAESLVLMRLRSGYGLLLIEVWDRVPSLPEIRECAGDSVNGRGLLIVETLSRYWGCHRVHDGKVVWALLG